MEKDSKKIDDCVKRFPTKKDNSFTLNGIKIEMQQRLLTIKEKHEYELHKNEILVDPDIFDASFTKTAITKKVNEEKEKQLAKLRAVNDDAEIEESEVAKIVDKFMSKEDEYKIRKNNLESEKRNWDNDIKLIAVSVTPNIFFGGYFKVDGKSYDTIEEIIDILHIMLPCDIDTLYINAMLLLYPTDDMVNEVKQ